MNQALSNNICSIDIALKSIVNWLWNFLKKLVALIFGHLCFVPAKQHQHLLLFLPHMCPKIRGNCTKSSENCVQMGPKITATTVYSFHEKTAILESSRRNVHKSNIIFRQTGLRSWQACQFSHKFTHTFVIVLLLLQLRQDVRIIVLKPLSFVSNG